MTDVYNTLDNNYTRLNKTLYISISVGAWAIQIEACCVMNFVSMHGWPIYAVVCDSIDDS